ncbi:MAG: hypothetical protein QW728_04830, partial [Thermoplasmata archaeon]
MVNTAESKAETTRQKAIRFFEYLQALVNIRNPVIRDLRGYREKFYLTIPSYPGCFTYGTGKLRDAIFEVHKQKCDEEPEVPQDLEQWLAGGYEEEFFTLEPVVEPPGQLPDAGNKKALLSNAPARPRFKKLLSDLTVEEEDELLHLPLKITYYEKLLGNGSTGGAAGINEPEAVLKMNQLKKRFEELSARKVLFEADPKRVEAARAYIARWDKWYLENGQKAMTNRIYSEYFSIKQRIEREEGLELFWGYGLLLWKKGDEQGSEK